MCRQNVITLYIFNAAKTEILKIGESEVGTIPILYRKKSEKIFVSSRKSQ